MLEQEQEPTHTETLLEEWTETRTQLKPKSLILFVITVFDNGLNQQTCNEMIMD